MDNFSFNQVTTVISREGVESDFQRISKLEDGKLRLLRLKSKNKNEEN